MKRAMLPLVASVLCLCGVADAQTITSTATIDDACVPRDAIFTVPAGRIATDFASTVTSGFHCTTGGPVANPAWGISTANACRSGNVFYQNRNDNGNLRETPVSLATLRLGAGQSCLHVDGGKTAKVTLTFRLVPGGGPGGTLPPGSGPTFGVLGPGGMPNCLIQLGPNGYSDGRLVLANTPYVIWWAPKRAGQEFTQVTSWIRVGPQTLAGGRRYLYRNGQVTSNPKPTTTVLSPGLASLHFENPGQTEGRWYMVNPLPPGCGANLVYGDTPVDATAGVSGTWTLSFQGDMTVRATLTLQQSGNTVTGSWPPPDGSNPRVEGSVNGRTLTLKRVTGRDTDQYYEVTVDGDRFSGTYWNVGKHPGKGTFTGERR